MSSISLSCLSFLRNRLKVYFAMLIKFVFCLCTLIVPWVLVVFYLWCRARVAPPVDETENELSFQDEFLPPEPPARRRGKGRARGELVEQVAVSRKSCRMTNLQIRILRKLRLY